MQRLVRNGLRHQPASPVSSIGFHVWRKPTTLPTVSRRAKRLCVAKEPKFHSQAARSRQHSWLSSQLGECPILRRPTSVHQTTAPQPIRFAQRCHSVRLNRAADRLEVRYGYHDRNPSEAGAGCNRPEGAESQTYLRCFPIIHAEETAQRQ